MLEFLQQSNQVRSDAFQSLTMELYKTVESRPDLLVKVSDGIEQIQSEIITKIREEESAQEQVDQQQI